jgi:membrane protease YdiL (CAAX protease family)
VRLPAVVFYSLAALGPLLAALIASSLEGGRPAIRALLAKLLKWRVGVRWYLVALLGYPGLLLAALALDLLLGGTPAWPIDDLRGIHMPFWFLLVLNPLFVLCEEIGWRGYALPRLQAAGGHTQRGRGALWATLVLWALWALWHVPSFLMRDSMHSRDLSFPLWTLWLLQMAIALTWLYNSTGGSVLHAWLYHMAMNYAGFLIPLGDRGRTFAGVLLVVATVLIVALAGPRRLGRRKVSG